MILHIDCNSFFASCEISFRPDLIGKPVVVANCNEAGGGIILALSKEAKALGLKRGNPVFKVKDILNAHKVAVFPANHHKYVDISRRLMQVVKEQGLVLNFKQYSVDEFFGELPSEDLDELRGTALEIKRHIEQCTGIPVSCGLSMSCTLAKVATWYAKHYDGYKGVCVLPFEKIETALKGFPIAEIWGIGRRTAPKLEAHGISTALQFYKCNLYEVRRLLNVNGIKTWQELHGTPSIDIENPVKQKSIAHTRTFAFMTDDLKQLHSYIAEFSVATARKLRDQHSVCQSVSVFLCTNPHRDDLQQYQNFGTERLGIATFNTMEITEAAVRVLERIYEPGYQYKRAGVVLSEISSDNAVQLDLFSSDVNDMEKSEKLMGVLDDITTKYGMDSVKLASQSFDKTEVKLNNFQPKLNQTTNINDIIKAK